MSGIAVHIAARVLARAGSGDTLVSSTVKDLVAGSGIGFEEVSGLLLTQPGTGWRLYRVKHGTAAETRAPYIATPNGVAHGPRESRLSRREREISALLAHGLTNRQIATELNISAGTVERHIANIFNKLGYHSRSQVAAWVVEQGLEQIPSA